MKIALSLIISLYSSLLLAETAIEPLVAWDKSEVRVCFGNQSHKSKSWVTHEKYDFIEYTNQQKNWIKKIITKEYNDGNTGISFVGWSDCTFDLKDIDVILFRTEPVIPESEGPVNVKGGMATLGEKGEVASDLDEQNHSIENYDKTKFPELNVVILNTGNTQDKKLSAEDYIGLLALHEFGHTAGLRHQHIIHQSALNDPNCNGFESMLATEQIFHSTIFTSGYDYNSVMNYCYINTLSSVSGNHFKAKSIDGSDGIKLSDPSLYSTSEVRNLFGKVVKNKLQYDVRIGLSANDKHALRCLYKNAEESLIQSCNVKI